MADRCLHFVPEPRGAGDVCANCGCSLQAHNVPIGEPSDRLSLSDLADYREDRDPDHPLTVALRELVQRFGLHGAVLVAFTDERVGVNSSAPNESFGEAMCTLADQILVGIDDGSLDGGLGGWVED